MASFHEALLICMITLALTRQTLSCWGSSGRSRGGSGGSGGSGGGSGGGGGGTSCPRIVSRSGWRARSPTARTSIRHPIPRVFIHHTVTPSCYSSSSCAARVRSIQTYHMGTRRWYDIGYNFLVGEDGNVYEGRGWDTVGAHASGRNDVSLGIAFIGDFSGRKPNIAALNAAKQLISCGVSKGKLSSAYRLHGHRDYWNTLCPGLALYYEIRTWSNYRSYR